MTGIKYLAFIADIYGISKDVREERIRKYADAFELTGALGSPIGGYSHGMKQKLAVISALIRAPRLLILDEPFVGLDPQAAFVLKGFLREICAAGGAVFFSTHVLEVAEKLCDRIAIIKGGRLVKMGTTASVVGDEFWNRCSWSWRRRAVHMRKLWVLFEAEFPRDAAGVFRSQRSGSSKKKAARGLGAPLLMAFWRCTFPACTAFCWPPCWRRWASWRWCCL